MDRDAGIVLNAIAGVDERDSTTMRDEISNEWVGDIG